MALTSKLEAIGDAIREQTGTTAKLSLDNMATTISEIEKPNDGILTIKQGDITKGTFTANSKGNVDVALDEVGKGTLTIKQGETSTTFNANATDDVTLDLGDTTINDATLTIKQGDTSKGTFTANAKSDVEIALDDVNDGTLTIKQGETTLGSFSANQKDASTITIDEPNNATLTIKAGAIEKGSFTANAKDNVEIALDEVNDATLTIKQEGETLSTFSANAKTNAEVDIKHATGAGNNHIPAGGATGDYLAYASDGTATWSATSDIVKDYAKLESPALIGTPTAPTAEAKTSTTQLATTEFVTSADTALLVDTPLTGTPTAPTATAGTNTTQLATTAYVMEALKPVTVYEGTGENYLTAKSSRVNITNVAITKTGYYYLTDVKFTFNSTAKASYGANEWFNIINTTETYRNLMHSYISYGIVHDSDTDGIMGGLISMAPSGGAYMVSFPVAKTVDATTIWHVQVSFIGKAAA